jgi:hypothetical protein
LASSRANTKSSRAAFAGTPVKEFFLGKFLNQTGSMFSNVVTNAEAIAAFGGDDHEAHIVQSRFDALTSQISRVTSIRFRFGMIEDFIVKCVPTRGCGFFGQKTTVFFLSSVLPFSPLTGTARRRWR